MLIEHCNYVCVPLVSCPPPLPAAAAGSSPVAALNAEHTIAANLVQGISNHLTNTLVIAGRDGGNVLQQQQQQQQYHCQLSLKVASAGSTTTSCRWWWWWWWS